MAGIAEVSPDRVVETTDVKEAEKQAFEKSNVRTVTEDGKIVGTIATKTYKTNTFKQGPSFETKMATNYANLESAIEEGLYFDSFEGQISYFADDDESDLLGIKSKRKGGTGFGGAIGKLIKPLAPKNLIGDLFNRNNNSPTPAPAPSAPVAQTEQAPINDIQYDTEAPINPTPVPKKILGMNQTTAIIVFAVVVVVIIAVLVFFLKKRKGK